ncbi:uncharacterized protein LOC116253896 [Nymphaea colorata]|nr:uncharacterized protein LOC116253896 [Nymphaea colorata]
MLSPVIALIDAPMNVVKEEAQVQRCSYCKSASELWLYDVRHRGIYRQLCAACLLKMHSSFFCPVCLEVYADGLPPENNIKCGNCPSTVHAACLAPELVPSYVCLCCANEFSFLTPLSSLSQNMQREEERKAVIIDVPAAKIILAAAQVAAISMTRAAASAWSEADKKVRDSAIARKKARDSLLHASQRVENQTTFAVLNQKKNTDKKTCPVKAEETEKPSRGMPNTSSAKKRMVNSEDDDKLKAFTSSFLQHRNIRNKATSETGKPKLAEDSVSSVKTLQCHLADALNKDEQDRLIGLRCEEGSSNSSSVLN